MNESFTVAVNRKTQLSLVVVPIAAACAAVMSIAFGIALYVYTRRKSVPSFTQFLFFQLPLPRQ